MLWFFLKIIFYYCEKEQIVFIENNFCTVYFNEKKKNFCSHSNVWRYFP